MDISKAILAKSDVLNAVDLIEPVTVTVVAVNPGDENTVRIVTDTFGPGRPYTPPKSVLRLIGGTYGKAWGKDTTAWVGRRLTIYNLPSVKYGGEVKGGVRISAMSDIDESITYTPPLADGLGKGGKLTIQPLPDAPVDPEKVTAAINAIRAAADTTTLDAIEKHAQQLGITGHITDTLNTRRTELGGDA